jgi:outer membrane protein assembly factor BamB
LLYVMSADTGEILWTHEGFLENAGLLGVGSPAVAEGLVIVPFSSGELYALRVENGRVAWSDTLMRTGLMTPMAALSDIDARPIIDGGRVYSVSNGGRMAAIDLRSGERLWERNIAGHQPPWLAGGFLFLVTDANEVVCISKIDGKIKWVTKLPRFKDEKHENVLQWTGPVLVSDRLILTSSHGYAASLSPYTGKFLGRAKLSGPIAVQPVVANNSLYLLTENAELVAMR